MTHNGEIMGDEKICKPHIALHIFKHIDDLALNAHIKRGNRLVTDDKLGLDCKRTGYADTLLLAAGEFMRIAVGMLGIEPYLRKQGLYHFRAFSLIVGYSVNVNRLSDYLSDRHARVE